MNTNIPLLANLQEIDHRLQQLPLEIRGEHWLGEEIPADTLFEQDSFKEVQPLQCVERVDAYTLQATFLAFEEYWLDCNASWEQRHALQTCWLSCERYLLPALGLELGSCIDLQLTKELIYKEHYPAEHEGVELRYVVRLYALR